MRFCVWMDTDDTLLFGRWKSYNHDIYYLTMGTKAAILVAQLRGIRLRGGTAYTADSKSAARLGLWVRIPPRLPVLAPVQRRSCVRLGLQATSARMGRGKIMPEKRYAYRDGAGGFLGF